MHLILNSSFEKLLIFCHTVTLMAIISELSVVFFVSVISSGGISHPNDPDHLLKYIYFCLTIEITNANINSRQCKYDRIKYLFFTDILAREMFAEHDAFKLIINILGGLLQVSI